MITSQSPFGTSARNLAALLPKHALPMRPELLAPQSALWLVLLMTLGLGLRSYHYFVDPPVWHDEAALICNVLHKDYSQMLGPLFYAEASPPLFLVFEKAVVAVLGDGTFALRLIPFLAGCIAVAALIALARPVLPRQSLLWFALIVGCSITLIWHCTEAKPYSVDLLVSTGLLWMFMRSRSADRASNQMLVCLTLIAPVLVFLSFPSMFLLGGAALTLLPGAWRGRSSRWLYATFALVLGGSFLVLYATAIQAQKNDELLSCWIARFPPWHRPWSLPTVTLQRFTDMFRYAAEPGGNLLCPLALVGAIHWWRSGYCWLVGFLAWPLALNAAAWLIGSYPMDASRVVVYTAPATLLLICAGIAPTWEWLGGRAAWLRVLLVALLLAPAVNTATTFVRPLTRRDSATPVAFVLARRQPDEPVVGTLWEQYYYCRRLGPCYRVLFPGGGAPVTPPAAAALDAAGKPTGARVPSLWLLTHGDPESQFCHVRDLEPRGTWQVVSKHDFRDVTVLHVVAMVRAER
jgi:hypothetical protein